MWLIVRSRPDRQVVAIHKGGLILPGFSAIIGLPNAHFVNLFPEVNALPRPILR